jgi:hypothetical protein
MNVEQIDAHVDEHLEKLEAADNSNLSGQQLQLANLCGVLHAAKPVLKFVRGLLFWKPKWQTVIDKVTEAIDNACPVS